MPITLTIDPERRLTITTCQGVVKDEELIRARQQLVANPAFDPTFDRIWDFHAVSEAQVSNAVIAQLVAESPPSEKPICRAVVISKQVAPVKAILEFLGCTRQARRRVAAFPDLDTAEKWITTARIDLPPE